MIPTTLCLLMVLSMQASSDEVSDSGSSTSEPTISQTTDTGPILSDDVPELTFDITPGAWLLRIRGDASNGVNAPEMKLDTQLGLTDLVTAFRGEAVIARGDWSVRISGSTFNTSGSTTAEEFSQWGSIQLSPGLDFTSSFDMAFASFEAGWKAWNPLGEDQLSEEHPLRLGFGPHVGISWLDIDQSLTASGETVSNGSSWWSVWGGATLDFEFDMKRFVSWMDSIRVYAMGGLGGTPIDGGFMWHVGGGFQFFFTPNIAASIGYRYEKYNLNDGDWSVNPNFQGLFLGATIQF
ncbi:MAG: hypothetical protein P8J89_10585 [Phycisphaerales bacterium]|nr:hypothetical protein [Phycisphaerales bacterium]